MTTEDGPSWSSMTQRHSWPKKGERHLQDPYDPDEDGKAKRVEELKPGDVAWWDEPVGNDARDEDGEPLEHPVRGFIVSMDEEYILCKADDAHTMLVPYDAIRTTEKGGKRARRKRETARGIGGF